MSAGLQRKPRKGSGAYLALKALHSLEGQALVARWHATAIATGVARASRLDEWDGIVQTLIKTGMVFRRQDQFSISDEGLEWLGVPAEVVPRDPPEAAPARYTPPMRPLSAKHRVNLRAMREGAFDYRDIPSRHGDELVAYRTSLTISGGDAQA